MTRAEARDNAAKSSRLSAVKKPEDIVGLDAPAERRKRARKAKSRAVARAIQNAMGETEHSSGFCVLCPFGVGFAFVRRRKRLD